MQIIVCKLEDLLCATHSKAPTPKHCLSATGTNKMLQHAGRIMKLTAVLLLGVCMQIYAAGYGQRITLSERDVPIEKVLKKIQAQTSYKFLYTSQLLSGIPKVTVVVKDATVEAVLDQVLKGQMLDYEVSEGTVVIRARKDVASVAQEAQAFVKDPIEIRGVITDENGAPASGVNVVVKGTSKGTTTNLRGEFVLRDVNENAVLLITSVGYDRQELLVKGKNNINTQLKVAVGNLDEMQVIAYGVTSKRLNTGNTSTIKSAIIGKQPINNPLLALQGRVPGLEITQISGVPGSAIKVQIRGKNSFNNGTDPLYIIDGVPYNGQLSPGLGSILGGSGVTNGVPVYGSPFSYINPSDIESIDVLKDADATAIYGSRAANGAILITTKKGKIGKTKIDINTYTGWGNVSKKLSLLDLRQYLDMRYEALRNDGVTDIPASDYDLSLWDTTRSTDWHKELIGGTAIFNNLQASVSGGNNQTQYLIGAGYQRESTVFPGDFSDKKISVRFNVSNLSANQKFYLMLSGGYLVDDNNLLQRDLTTFVRLSPNAPSLYKDDGTLNWAANSSGTATWTNPLSYTNGEYKNNTSNLISNAMISYELMPGFKVKSNFGFTSMQSNEIQIFPLSFFDPNRWSTITSYSTFANNDNKSYIIEPQLTYEKKIGRGEFSVLLGSTIQKNIRKGIMLRGEGFTNDDLIENIRAASKVTVNYLENSLYKYHAFFGRVNYNWQEKYLANITARRDGSSRFGADNRLHNFGALGLGWIFSSENFVKRSLPILSFGKIRGSYGTTGSDQIGDYRYLDRYFPTSLTYQGVTGLVINNLFNPNLAWEETRKFETGLEIGMYNDRVNFSVSYFNNLSSNQLVGYSLPSTTGFSRVDANQDAKIKNQGWEFVLNTKNIESKNISWTSAFNLTRSRNKLIDVGATALGIDRSLIGHSLNSSYVYAFLDVDESSGVYRFLDKKGAPTFSPDTAFFKDDLNPSYYGGFQNSINYKEFRVDLFFQFVKQIAYYNKFGIYPGVLESAPNQMTKVLDRWQKPGDIKPIQRYNQDYSYYTEYDYAAMSDACYADASFIRLKNVAISYDLSNKIKSKIRIQSCRIYVLCQNLFTITKYDEFDPETKSISSLPPLRVITTGIQVSL